MPVMGETQEQQITTKLLLLGDNKAGKTHYAMQAAEAGYDVLVADADVAAPTLAKLSQKAKNHVFYMPIHDYMDANGGYVCFAAEFLVAFTTNGKFMWNDTLGRVFNLKDYVSGEGGHEVWEIRPAMMDTSVLFLLDSWTRIVSSLVTWKADDLAIDLLEIEKYGREMYTGAGHKATQFLKLLGTLKCHVCVIGHPREYVKRSAPKGSKGQVAEKDMKIDWIQMVPVSTSNPHALTMGSNFSDIGWIDVTAMGARMIDFKPSDSRTIGGTLNVSGKVEDLPITKLLTCDGQYPVPSPNRDRWITRWPNGTYEPAARRVAPVLGATKATTESPLDPASPEPKKISGLSALASLKPGGVQR